MGDTEQSISR